MINTFYYENNLCGLKRSDFQRTIDGKDVDLFILKNDNGAEMAITNYGGALLAIMVPDKDGNLANVIQGHDTLDGVIHSPEAFLSTLIGRYGNRIAKGKFQLGVLPDSTPAYGMQNKPANKVLHFVIYPKTAKKDSPETSIYK